MYTHLFIYNLKYKKKGFTKTNLGHYMFFFSYGRLKAKNMTSVYNIDIFNILEF